MDVLVPPVKSTPIGMRTLRVTGNDGTYGELVGFTMLET
jgi:hypothetical protein